MGSSFIPSGSQATGEERTISNDGWYPDISLQAMKAETGLDDTWRSDHVVSALRVAVVEVNAILRPWRADQSVATLADLPGSIDGEAVAVILYRTAVHTRARGLLLEVTRDFDSTKSGHARADALIGTADAWLARSHEALGRLTGRPRATIELI